MLQITIHLQASRTKHHAHSIQHNINNTNAQTGYVIRFLNWGE